MTTAIDNIPFRRMDGVDTTLAAYRGKVLLLVNVASRCGLTLQYAGLERLFEEYREAGLMVIGFPANDFGAQEPGSNEEIEQFCGMTYRVTFPLAEKLSVKGPGQHPLYAALTVAHPLALDPELGAMKAKLAGHGFEQANSSDVLWNFEKFLVDRTGRLVARFNPDVAPDNPLLLTAIAQELAI